MSQTDLIYNHLKTGKEISPMDALQLFGCFRLAARIKDLRDRGVSVETKEVRKNGKSYAVYRLEEARSLFDL